ncbi:MAG: hypothetical protein IJN90_03895 [Bacilli bacterium]|nr:hypothetical protein [Bacilli bacterium]
MFEELLQQYQKLPIDSKREKNIEELKLVVAMLQLLCDHKKIKYEDINIVDTNSFQNESEYLNIIYTYVTALKEQLGSYVLEVEKK